MAIKFNRLVILFNPKSSNAKLAHKTIARLKKIYPDKVVLENIGDSAEANLKLLNKHLQPGDVLVPAGGDGTISHLAEHMLQPEVPENLKKTPILLLGTGRMNDIARNLNGKNFDNPHYILQHGREIKIHPIECTLTPLKSGKPRTFSALHSIGFGYSAEASKTYNDQGFRIRQRKRPLLTREIELFKVSSNILKDARYFDIDYKGIKKPVLDISVVNGSSLGKYYRLPSRLSERKFYIAIMDDKSFLHTVHMVATLMANRFSGGKLTNRISFIVHNKTNMHVGGETLDTPKTPYKVEMAIGKKPLIMIASEPNP